MDAYDAMEIDFHEAMAALNGEIQKGNAMAAALREFAARYDTMHALIMRSGDTDSYSMRESVAHYNPAAATLAEIGRDIERHECARAQGESATGTDQV